MFTVKLFKFKAIPITPLGSNLTISPDFKFGKPVTVAIPSITENTKPCSVELPKFFLTIFLTFNPFMLVFGLIFKLSLDLTCKLAFGPAFKLAFGLGFKLVLTLGFV